MPPTSADLLLLGYPFPSTMGRLADGTTTATTLTVGGHKPRFLCLHGFRTSGAIMRTQVVGKWPAEVTSRLDLVFADAPFPAEGKSDVDGIFDPPYYEWFQFDKDFMTYRNFDECLAYIEELMIKQGPFDGLMGFSQGAILSAALPGLQAKGLALTRVPKIKYLMIISGAKFKSPELAEKAFSSKIACPSLHFLGETDFLKLNGEALLDEFIDPLVIRHPKGHTVPRLGGGIIKERNMLGRGVDPIQYLLRLKYDGLILVGGYRSTVQTGVLHACLKVHTSSDEVSQVWRFRWSTHQWMWEHGSSGIRCGSTVQAGFDVGARFKRDSLRQA